MKQADYNAKSMICFECRKTVVFENSARKMDFLSIKLKSQK